MPYVLEKYAEATSEPTWKTHFPRKRLAKELVRKEYPDYPGRWVEVRTNEWKIQVSDKVYFRLRKIVSHPVTLR